MDKKNVNIIPIVLEEDRSVLRCSQHKTLRLRSYRTPQRDRKGNEFNTPIPVEQRFSKEFNNKANGWPQSDISRLVDSTSVLEMQQLLNKMKATNVPSNDSNKLTLEQKFLATKPRFVDTPNERERFMNYAMNQTGLSEDDLFAFAEKDGKEDKEKTLDNTSALESSPS